MGAGSRLVKNSRRAIAWALGDLMIRYFLVMAVTGGSLLVADFVLGFFATGEPHGPGAIARGIHVLFSLVTVVALLGIHSIVYTYFVATGKWAKEVVHAYQLPDWISTQATKNKTASVSVHHGEHDGDRHRRLAGGGRRHPRPGLRDLASGSGGVRTGLQPRFLRGGIRRDRRSCPAAGRAQGPRRSTA